MLADHYQSQAKTTAIFPDEVANVYLPLDLFGESGEVAEIVLKAIERANLGENSISHTLTCISLREFIRQSKYLERTKKLIRDGNVVNTDKDYSWVKNVEFTPEEKDQLKKECGGDVSWYSSGILGRIGVKLSEALQCNLDKLFKRKAEGKISGSGSDR